jgi:acetyl-CoA acyltransferase
MHEAVIVDAIRTPVGRGRPGGALAGWHPVDLLAHTLSALVARAGIDANLIDDVLVGCVSQVGEQSQNLARNAVLAAGFDESVPGVTIDRQCGSSQQAVHFAAQGVIAGAYDLVIAAGVEMMSRVPLGSAADGRDPFGDRVASRYGGGLVHQGVAAELIAARWELTRAEVDAYAARSQERAIAAADAGVLDGGIIEVPVDRGEGPTGETLIRDEGLRETTPEALAGLPPVFVDDATEDWFGPLPGVVHAGSASQVSDGAAAVLVAAREVAASLGLRARARTVAFAVTGDDPVLMLAGVIPATHRVLERAGLGVDDIDVFEVSEAFAPVVLAWLRETGADDTRVNRWGGAIANGHPVGASGAKLLTTLVDGLEHVGGRYGLQVMCEGGGMANALIIERTT